MKNNIINKTEKGILKAAEIFNVIAGWAIVASMVLVVANIILRTVFKIRFWEHMSIQAF